MSFFNKKIEIAESTFQQVQYYFDSKYCLSLLAINVKSFFFMGAKFRGFLKKNAFS